MFCFTAIGLLCCFGTACNRCFNDYVEVHYDSAQLNSGSIPARTFLRVWQWTQLDCACSSSMHRVKYFKHSFGVLASCTLNSAPDAAVLHRSPPFRNGLFPRRSVRSSHQEYVVAVRCVPHRTCSHSLQHPQAGTRSWGAYHAVHLARCRQTLCRDAAIAAGNDLLLIVIALPIKAHFHIYTFFSVARNFQPIEYYTREAFSLPNILPNGKCN